MSVPLNECSFFLWVAFVYDGQSSHGARFGQRGHCRICIGAEDRRPRPAVGCHDTALDQSGILPRRGKQRLRIAVSLFDGQSSHGGGG